MGLCFCCQQALSRAFSQLRRRVRQFRLQRLLIGGHNLAPQPSIQIDEDRSPQIHYTTAILLADDAQCIQPVSFLKRQGRQLAFADPNPVVFLESARADHRQGGGRSVGALQPTNGGVVGVRQQHPVPAVLKSNDAVRKVEQIVNIDSQRAKSCGRDLHDGTPG